jgi:hypothetical protein
MASRRPPRHLRIFLASPADVIEERQTVREVLQQMQRAPLVRQDFTIEVVSWDDPDAPVPMLATLTPQQAVVRALPKPSECDLTVMILAGRIGTPLNDHKPDGKLYRSGTEWEFEDARQAGKPILLYRCLEPRVFPGEDDAEATRQRKRVEEFFAQFRSASGSFTGGVTDYRTVSDFARRLRTDVEGLLRSLSESDAALVTDRRPPHGWFGRAQLRVGRWHLGRLVMTLVLGVGISVIAWTAFGTFSRVAEEYDAPPLAHAIRYLMLVIGVLVPSVLLVLIWWWLGRDRAGEAG